jgi:hypothetical protein
MTRTEDRLTEYLNAVADSVRADSTRPLAPPVAPAAGRERTCGARRIGVGQRRWRGWAVPLAAAAGVVAVAVSGALLAGQLGGHRAAPAAAGTAEPGGGTPGLKYYMEEEAEGEDNTLTAVVRSVATGAVIDRVPNPGGSDVWAMAAAPGDRTFYIAYGPAAHGKRFMIYSVSVLGPGKVTAPMPVKGGVVTFTNFAEGLPTLAVSPDGGRLAMTLSTYTVPPPGFTFPQQVVNEILVLNLHTGTRQVWQGGLARTGYTVTVRSVAWAGNGRSLDFLATWCAQGRPYGGACYPYMTEPHASSQVRSLPLSSGGGNLDASTVLLREPYLVAWMSAAPGGDIDLMTLSVWERATPLPRSLTVGQYSPDGTLKRVLYRRGDTSLFINSSSLTTDSSGSHLLLGLVLTRCTGNTCSDSRAMLGWIDGGTFHPLTSYANWLSVAAW